MPDQPQNGAGGEGRGGSSRERKPFLLRLPPDLLDELRSWSAAELRSLNGHIEFLLRAAVRRKRGEEGPS